MRRALLVLIPVFAAACLSTADNTLQLDPTDTNVTGAFSLSSINGTPLPVLASVTTTQEFDLTSDTVSLASDGTWTETSVYKVTMLTDNTATTTATVISGTYTLANQQINFVQTSTGGTLTFSGSVKGTRLTIVFGGSQFLYNRST